VCEELKKPNEEKNIQRMTSRKETTTEEGIQVWRENRREDKEALRNNK
jgi:hypothetical protein